MAMTALNIMYLNGCITEDGTGYIHTAVVLGYMTEGEWHRLVEYSWQTRDDYIALRGMMAMFVLLAEGEDF